MVPEGIVHFPSLLPGHEELQDILHFIDRMC